MAFFAKTPAEALS